MSEEKKHTIYTATDIEKYLSGKLLPAQMYEIEKAALEDDFLAEAIEGYAGMEKENWSAQSKSLMQHFVERDNVISARSSIKTLYWKAAAAVLIIVTGIAISYQLANKNKGEIQTAAVTSTQKDTVKIDSEKTITKTGIAADSIDINLSKANDQATMVRPAKPSPGVPPSASGHANDIPTYDSTGSYELTLKNSREDQNNARVAPQVRYKDLAGEVVNNRQATLIMKAPESLSKTESSLYIGKAKEKFFTGQIVDTDDTPLPFAGISIPVENTRTYADVKGYFKLQAPDSILPVEIKSAGFLSRRYTLQSKVANNKIVLAEDKTPPAERTIIIGNGRQITKKRTSILTPDSTANVEPEDGWDDYDTYVSNNLLWPDDMVQKNIHGQVEVSFDVQSSGIISNFKIDKSLCSGCDEEVLRTIKEGPRWKVKKGKQATGKVKINF